MKPLFVGVFLFASCGLALAQAVPLPRAKPQLSGAADPLLPQVLPLHDAQVWPSNCTLRLVEIARFTHQPTVNGPSQCGAGDLVRLEGIMSNSRLISVRPAAILRCPMAEAVAQWVRADLGPILGELELPPVAITNGGSYDCRGRNNDSRAKISEHGRGNALDLGPIRLANGATVDLSNRFASQSIRQRLRDTACHRFSTVLGPGSDPFHADHIHVDLAERTGGYRLCQWDVGVGAPEPAAEVPMPRPKPAAEDTSSKRPTRSREAVSPMRQPNR